MLTRLTRFAPPAAERPRWAVRLLDGCLWLALAVPLTAALGGVSPMRTWTAALGVPLLAAAVAVSRKWPLVALAVPVALGLVTSRDLFTFEYTAALAVLAYLAGVRLEGARAPLWFFAGVAAVSLPLSAVVVRNMWPWFTAVLTLLFNIVLPWLLGRYRRQYAALVRSGWQLAERLEHEQQAVADRTRLRERARIAGDMHDSLGHELALLTLRAGALEVDPRLAPDQRAAVGELRAAAGTAAEHLRDVIGVLRTDDRAEPSRVPADDSVEALVARARSAGLAVSLRRDGAVEAGEGAMPVMGGRAVYRVVQEGLTNAAKHAPGAPVDVRLTGDGRRLDVTVTNAAPPPGTVPVPAPGPGGSGLVGLDERVRLAGGELRAGPTPEGGFEVAARLPTTGRAPVRGSGDHAPWSRSQRELAAARQQVRRRLVQTVTVPAALFTGLLLLMGIFALVSPSWSVLDRGTYERIRTGDAREVVEARLPFFSMDVPPDGTPDPPPGRTCRYYYIRPYADDVAYQLCFADARLASKGVVHRRDRPSPG
ncbi:two-component sensor histidine kinase [Streptomyces chrestomyceticus JCM 4735]|uniref:histidine kinase n=1 Tax=Streptomyces chrestomyceticus JCM 4735 TaxID=1306181 RepID=A0A7U9KTZ3_9ACTN|nr:histidine kinase [Streptomyces chrestomyceticus]GCD34738.1 two-component sensor histidine kinase [Streptomyces chrestomyceticus JCM 4735]